MERINNNPLLKANLPRSKTLRLGMNTLTRIVLCAYFILSIFEPYLNGMIGSLMKYYILIVITVILIKAKGRIQLQLISKAYIVWLLFKIVSSLWSTNIATVKLYFISQIGMVLFLVVLFSEPVDKKTIEWIIVCYWLSSAVLGLMSIFMSRSYMGVYSLRQVIVVAGVEIDPNNQAALLLVGIGISLVQIFFEKKYIIPAIIILLINSYGTFITGSRGGLVTIFAATLFVVMLPNKKQKISQTIGRALFVIIVFIGIMTIAQRFVSSNTYNRLFSFDGYLAGSGRSVLWRLIWEEYTRDLIRILFGTGWGSYSRIVQIGATGSAHNTFLTILSDVGLIGFLLFIVPLWEMLKSMIQQRQQLPIMLIIVQFIPAFFLDSIHKRFFWNAIFILGLYYFSSKKETTGLKNKDEDTSSD